MNTPTTVNSTANPTANPTVREAQSQEDYNPLAKQKSAAKLSRIPVKVVQGEILRKPDWIRVKVLAAGGYPGLQGAK